MDSRYDDIERIRDAVARGEHRQVVGTLWDELGTLQLDFMKGAGLEPHHFFLDVGCGSLRGGVKFVRYLDPGRYFGLDINESLLSVGYTAELVDDLRDKLPRKNLMCSDNFEIQLPNETFDFMLAQSLFTHLSFNRIRHCLEKVAAKIKKGGTLFATFFEISGDVISHEPHEHHPGAVVTYGCRDPYHYRFKDLQFAALNLPFDVRYIGNWKHPRGQNMVAFVRRNDTGVAVDCSVRRMSA